MLSTHRATRFQVSASRSMPPMTWSGSWTTATLLKTQRSYGKKLCSAVSWTPGQNMHSGLYALPPCTGRSRSIRAKKERGSRNTRPPHDLVPMIRLLLSTTISVLLSARQSVISHPAVHWSHDHIQLELGPIDGARWKQRGNVVRHPATQHSPSMIRSKGWVKKSNPEWLRRCQRGAFANRVWREEPHDTNLVVVHHRLLSLHYLLDCIHSGMSSPKTVLVWRQISDSYTGLDKFSV